MITAPYDLQHKLLRIFLRTKFIYPSLSNQNELLQLSDRHMTMTLLRMSHSPIGKM